MTTEAEAKTKWCPMVRAVIQIGEVSDHAVALGTTNLDVNMTGRHGGNQTGAYCIGSDCMMWRWDGWPEGAKPEEQEGHCGLAGDLGFVVRSIKR